MPPPHSSHFEKLINNPLCSDVTLLTTDDQRYYAHKAILSAVSPVFLRMFRDSCYVESSASKLTVPYTSDTFLHVLQYIYTGATPSSLVQTSNRDTLQPGGESAPPPPKTMLLPLAESLTLRSDSGISITGGGGGEVGSGNAEQSSLLNHWAVPLLDAATFYDLESLRDVAVDSLRRYITCDNALSMLHVALGFNATVLRDHCISTVRQHNTEVLHSPQWLQLPLAVATLLLHETIIEGDLVILKRCVEWCEQNCSNNNSPGTTAAAATDDSAEPQHGTATKTVLQRSDAFHAAMASFLPYIDFTNMTPQEVDEVESMSCVPLAVLYDRFKRHSLALPPTHLPRKGGIILQWEQPTSGSPFSSTSNAHQQQHHTDVEIRDNHVVKTSSDYMPHTVYAINRFSKGRHYFTFTIVDFRSPHDCLVGVSFRSPLNAAGLPSSSTDSPLLQPHSPLSSDRDYHFEPCCMKLCVPPGTEVIPHVMPKTPLLSDHWCVIGVLVDFHQNLIQWYNHGTKQLLFTAKPPLPMSELLMDGDEEAHLLDPAAAALRDAARQPLERPLVPSAILYHKSNGGILLAESTSFLGERCSRDTLEARVATARATSATGVNGTPVKKMLGSPSGSSARRRVY